MRKLVTGVDEAGRSCAVEDLEMPFPPVDPAHPDGRMWATVFQTQECPPPARPAGRGEYLNVGTQVPGLVRWRLNRFAPSAEAPTHHTDTVDIDMVLEGSIEIVLDDGPHRLDPGDCVVV